MVWMSTGFNRGTWTASSCFRCRLLKSTLFCLISLLNLLCSWFSKFCTFLLCSSLPYHRILLPLTSIPPPYSVWNCQRCFLNFVFNIFNYFPIFIYIIILLIWNQNDDYEFHVTWKQCVTERTQRFSILFHTVSSLRHSTSVFRTHSQGSCRI